jgi:hypothetical protein
MVTRAEDRWIFPKNLYSSLPSASIHIKGTNSLCELCPLGLHTLSLSPMETEQIRPKDRGGKH